jgi:hypothetical protein
MLYLWLLIYQIFQVLKNKMNNNDLKDKLKLINEDIALVKERNDIKKKIAEAKKERFLLKLGFKSKQKNDK